MMVVENPSIRPLDSHDYRFLGSTPPENEHVEKEPS